jgi:hypothetical protein
VRILQGIDVTSAHRASHILELQSKDRGHYWDKNIEYRNTVAAGTPRAAMLPFPPRPLVAPLFCVDLATDELEVDVLEDESFRFSAFIARHSDCVMPCRH